MQDVCNVLRAGAKFYSFSISKKVFICEAQYDFAKNIQLAHNTTDYIDANLDCVK